MKLTNPWDEVELYIRNRDREEPVRPEVGVDNGSINANSRERRRHPRFRALEGAFVALSPGYHKVGRIIDFGIGGLAFTYVEADAEKDEPSKLTLFFLTDEPFYVDRVPIETVYDYNLFGKLQTDYLKIRRCGVRFGELETSLLSQIEYFLSNYTV